jgi:hypothetical protein
MAFVVLGLVLSVPAFAVPALTDEPFTGTPGGGGGTRTNDCPGTVVWDTGMFDEFTPPTGCATSGSAGCFVNAVNEGGFPADGRRIADDFFVVAPTYISHVKTWGRLNAQGYADGVRPLGFCVKFYEQDEANVWCPDGTVPGEEAIGTIAYDQYVGAGGFVEQELTTGLIRNFNYCITLPVPFLAQPGKIYFLSVSADYNFQLGLDGLAYTQWFNRMYEGAYDPYCEASFWDTWNDPETPWNAISIAINIPCWAGWNTGFVLYENGGPETGACCIPGAACFVTTQDQCQGGQFYPGVTCDPDPCPPVPVEEKTWGQIKNQYR